MHLQSALLLCLSSATAAFDLQPRNSSTSNCPPVWSDVVKDLESDFAGCNDNAHAAIRAPFHDCVINGCDGSLILGGECSRSENAGLTDVCNYLGNKATQYNVGAADMISVAAATAIAICPMGPRVRALVGRTDSSVPAPEGQIPSTSDPVDKILATFGAVGMSAQDVVALVGSHTVARQSFDDPDKAGAALDTSPGTFDNTFYEETKEGTAPYSFSSDRRMSNDSEVRLEVVQSHYVQS